ncbi:hypothetical protein ACS0TY_012539 [Phlomoides rotata]
MEYEDQEEEQEAEVGLAQGYNESSLGHPNSTRSPTKMPSPLDAAAPLRKHRYKECLKNHAVGIGGLESLKCAACGCHRNFHRRENESGGGAFPFHQYPPQQQLLLAHHPHGHFGYRSPSGYLHVAPQARAAPLALPSSSGGGGWSGSRDEMEDYYSQPSSASAKKRFRTKFTQEHKEKMLNLD